MSIFLLMRLCASSLLHRFGWTGLVQTPSDDLTPATVLAVNPLSPAGHIVAHFNDSEIASTRLKEISNGMV
jgi:voltage-gated potassium channel